MRMSGVLIPTTGASDDEDGEDEEDDEDEEDEKDGEDGEDEEEDSFGFVISAGLGGGNKT